MKVRALISIDVMRTPLSCCPANLCRVRPLRWDDELTCLASFIGRLSIHLLRLIGRLRICVETWEGAGCHFMGKRSQKVLLHVCGGTRKHPAVH